MSFVLIELRCSFALCWVVGFVLFSVVGCYCLLFGYEWFLLLLYINRWFLWWFGRSFALCDCIGVTCCLVFAFCWFGLG